MQSKPNQKIGILVIAFSSFLVLPCLFYALLSLDRIREQNDRLSHSINLLSDKIVSLNQKTEKYRTSFDSLSESSIVVGEQLNKTLFDLSNLKVSLDNFKEQNGNLFHSVVSKMDNFENEISKLAKVETFTDELDSSTGNIREDNLRILQKNPNDSESLSILGQICMEEGDIHSAKTYYEKIVELEPFNSEAYEALGRISLKENDYRKAVYIYSRLIRLEAENALNYYYLALSLYHSGQLAEADNSIETSLSFNPDYVFALNLAAHIKGDQGYHNDAMAFLKKSISLKEDPFIYELIGDVYMKQNLLIEALDLWEIAIRTFDKNKEKEFTSTLEVYEKIAISAFESGEYQRIDQYIKEVKLLGGNEVVHFYYLRSLNTRNRKNLLLDEIQQFEVLYPRSLYQSELAVMKSQASGV